MRSAEIHSRFLKFFEERGHAVLPSASLITDDPTLLLVNAGMVPFKPYFLGEATPPYQRAATVQKCVRTLDIEEVGRTTRHGSFFQMAGNFSFGDYFKQGAIELAWELLTRPVAAGGLGLEESRLWVTIFQDDDEAERLWLRTGVPASRIQRLGMADNFWSMGVPGPCGPDSEIWIDRGPDYGPDGGPAASDERYIELWNLVFMQFVRGPGEGKDDFPILGDLPAPSIDTGMGLERMASVLQGVENLYEIDTSRTILDRAAQLTGARYGSDPNTDIRLRVVADHVRTSVMLVGDGVLPANEGRGYVLRRIIRRAVRAMRLLGAREATAPQLVAAAIAAMGPQYPELVTDAARIHGVVEAEEGSFLETLQKGAVIFDTAVPEARQNDGELSAAQAFTLHDTYGFPFELTLEMAAEEGLTVDEAGFRALMAEQRQRAKADAQARKTGLAGGAELRQLLEQAGPTEFTGYQEVRSEAVVRGLLQDGRLTDAAAAGAEVDLALDRTPFYAEAGGQLADTGKLQLADGAVLEVLDVQRVLPDLVLHRCRVVTGEVRPGAPADAQVDVERRRAISRAHTATHLVHRALRRAVGEQAAQAGSMNAPGRFRFDFSAPGAVSAAALSDVEQEINEVALADLEVRAFVTSQDEARRIGAIALFGEKYGERVRVVEVGDYARELCGGTHAARSGQLGMVTLLSESSIGAGVRRVEGLVGIDAYQYLARERALLSAVAGALKVAPGEAPDRVAATVAKLRAAEKELAAAQAGQLLSRAAQIAATARDVYGIAFVGAEVAAGTSGELLRNLALAVRGQLPADRPAGVVVAAGGDRVTLVAAVNDAGQRRGLSANELLRIAAPAIGGKGGGKEDVAQGGGTDPAGIAEALRRAEHLVGRVASSG